MKSDYAKRYLNLSVFESKYPSTAPIEYDANNTEIKSRPDGSEPVTRKNNNINETIPATAPRIPKPAINIVFCMLIDHKFIGHL